MHYGSNSVRLSGDHCRNALLTGRLGLPRFEDPTFQDDLEWARQREAQGGLELLTYGMRVLLSAFTIAGLAQRGRYAELFEMQAGRYR